MAWGGGGTRVFGGSRSSGVVDPARCQWLLHSAYRLLLRTDVAFAVERDRSAEFRTAQRTEPVPWTPVGATDAICKVCLRWLALSEFSIVVYSRTPRVVALLHFANIPGHVFKF